MIGKRPMIRRMMVMGWAIAAIIHLAGASQAQAKVVTVGVVTDGAGAESGLLMKVEKALEDLRDPEVTMRFKRASGFNAGWDPAKADAAVRSALGDSEVDLVVAYEDLLGIRFVLVPIARDVV